MLQILLTRNWASGESARYTDKTNHVIDRIISVALRSLMMPGRIAGTNTFTLMILLRILALNERSIVITRGEHDNLNS